MSRRSPVLLAALLLACPARDGTDRPARPVPKPERPATPARGAAELGEHARRLWREVACAVPSKDEHCRRLQAEYHLHRQRLRERQQPFFERVRPLRLPGAVVYPFSGGDLGSALAVFPDADEITTISLEHAGDPRALHHLEGRQLEDQLELLRRSVRASLRVAHSSTRTLDLLEASALPAPLALALTALVIHDLEPVSLRYLRIERDGAVRYLTEAEIQHDETERARPLREGRRPSCSPAFSHLELRFRRRGARGPTRVYRHLAANLEDTHLRQWPGLLRHLRAKGRIAAMTKAASYLLWRDRFSMIRAYLVSQADWIVCDSSGPPLAEARAAGLEVRSFGIYRGAFLPGVPQLRDEELRAFWLSSPPRALPFRFGYPDRERNAHLLIMARPALLTQSIR